jgi:hypothetical protein
MMQPGYRAMFRDFGSGTLPLITRIMLNPLTLIIAAVLPMGFVAEGVLRQRSEGAQLARCVVAMVGAAGLVVGFLVALYLPMFKLAGEIR